MKLLNFSQNLTSKHIQVLHSIEMDIEKTINKFRLGLLIFIVLGDLLGFDVKNIESILTLNDILIGFAIIIIFIVVIIFINRFTSTGKYFGGLKYFTVSFDLFVCYFLSLIYSDASVQTNLNNGDLAIIFFLLLITFNTLSTLRVSKKIILFSCTFTCIYSWQILKEFHMNSVVIVYAIISILFLSAINLKLAKGVFQNIISKIDLEELNEEILAQKDELALQNKRITDSVFYAQRIQQALLPPRINILSQIPEHYIFL